MLSLGKATMHELNTTLSVEDCYDLIEIAVIDAHNAKLIKAANEGK